METSVQNDVANSVVIARIGASVLTLYRSLPPD